MLDRWYKIVGIAASAVIILAAIAGPSIGGIFWLAQLNNEVRDLREDSSELQTDFAELQTDFAELQKDVDELQHGQTIILEILQDLANEMPELRNDLEILQDLVNEMPELRNDLDNHIHDPDDGGTQFPAGQ